MSQKEDHIRQQLLSRPCSFCQKSGPPASYQVITQHAQAWIVRKTCSFCHHRVLLLVSFAPKKLSPLPSSVPYFPFPAVSNRDVMQMRTFLDTFNGDFLSLFDRGPQGLSS